MAQLHISLADLLSSLKKGMHIDGRDHRKHLERIRPQETLSTLNGLDTEVHSIHQSTHEENQTVIRLVGPGRSEDIVGDDMFQMSNGEGHFVFLKKSVDVDGSRKGDGHGCLVDKI